MSDRSEQPDKARREFMGKAAAAVAAVSVAPGLTLFNMAGARPPDEAVTSAQRWGMLVDVNRCAHGCNACQEACDEENGITSHGRPATDARWIRKVTLRDRQTAREYTLPLMCQHCEYPPCVDVCPTGASFRRVDGIVLVDKHICIGCRYCMLACPYKARSFIHEDVTGQKSYAPRGKGTVESCTLCVHRVDSGRTPACAEACGREGNQALLFGDLNDPSGKLAQTLKKVSSRQIREDLALNTGIRYHGI
jgi:molybdopterin-containing oxidoreductase family iron-sulfur binding subunit